MTLAVVSSRALCGLHAPEVLVEVHLAPGLPAFTIVGMPDTGVRESRERVRSAIQNSGYSFPCGRLTANLAPADIPKESGRFDLPIALGVLLATDQLCLADTVAAHGLSNIIFAGELSLTGALVPVAAPLVIALAAFRANPDCVLVLPWQNARLAASVPGLRVLGARTLKEVILHLEDREHLDPAQAAPARSPMSEPELCLSEVKGQAIACRALEVAASGGHGLLLSGPPGVGKSMLAHRLPGLLPDLEQTASIELAAIRSLREHCGQISTRPPLRAPHHSITTTALIGGGGNPKPGEISMAHHGVLFLDELPEFKAQTLESLREPLESGEVHIARAYRSASYPCRFQLIAAMNPCPCGYLGSVQRRCRCTPEQIRLYQSKLSGPLLDRIDLLLQVSAPAQGWQTDNGSEPSAVVRGRVTECRQLQWRRQGELNARLAPGLLGQYCKLDDKAGHLLQQAIGHWGLSARAVHRLLRVARTLSDMLGQPDIGAVQLNEALALRQQLPDG